MKQLDLTSCKTNEEVVNSIKNHISSISLEELTKSLSEDFVFQDKAIRKVYTALATGKNAILYGPGGFGKSALTKAICRKLGLPIIYKIGYEGMTAEELLGVPNMTRLLKDSTYEVAFENSVFAKPGILILEEFLDCGPSTAAALKDILSERGFREGDNKKESLIASVIITGNKDPKSLAKDDSSGAFYKERFPIWYKVIWESNKASNYLQFFNAYYKDEYVNNFKMFNLLSVLCENTSDFVSPRIATEAADVMLELGIEFIDTIEGIDTSNLEKWKKETEKTQRLLSETEVLDEASKYINKVTPKEKTLENIVKFNLILTSVGQELTKVKFSDENVPEYSTLLVRVKGLMEQNTIDMGNIVDIQSEVSELSKFKTK